MFPVLFHKGPVILYTYGLMVALGFIVVLEWSRRKAKSWGFTSELVSDFCFYVFLAGLAGARLVYVLENLSYYKDHPWETLMLFKGGLVFYGGLAVAVAFAYVWLRRRQVKPLAFADFFLPYLPLGHALGRIGCFFNGCCYGKILEPGPVPVQLYEAGFNVLLTVHLLAIRKKYRHRGLVLPHYLFFYGLGRFVLEFWRGDDVPMWFGLRISQWGSLAAIVVAIVIFVVKRKSLKKAPEKKSEKKTEKKHARRKKRT